MIQNALPPLLDVGQCRPADPGPLGDLSLGEPSRASSKGELHPERPVLGFNITVDSLVIHPNIVVRFAILSNVQVPSRAVLDRVARR